MAQQAPVKKEETKAKTKPVTTVRCGGIKATVWANEMKNKDGSTFVVHNVNLDRSYKDQDGQWQTTNSIRQADVPKAILVLQKAYEYCVLSKADEPSDEE